MTPESVLTIGDQALELTVLLMVVLLVPALLLPPLWCLALHVRIPVWI